MMHKLITAALTVLIVIIITNNTNSADTTTTTTRDDHDGYQILMICNETFRVELEYLLSLNESGSFPDESDKTPKCFIWCVLEHTKVMNENGDIDVTTTINLFGERHEEHVISNMTTMCAMRDETCKCEKAYNFVKCLIEAEITYNDSKI